MAHRSEEGNTPGLGWLDAEVVRFKVGDRLRFKVPHIGWNEIVARRKSGLLKRIPDRAAFYFVHAYHLVAKLSAVESESVFGVQFHPEKSHDLGELLLQNFAGL
jgi:glutamine amidotransferase